MAICENCGKEHDGSYGSGRFCNISCRSSYINKTRIIENNKRSKDSIDKALQSLNICNIVLGNFKLCEDNIKTCKVCGRMYFSYDKTCLNEFCNKHTIQQFESLIKYFGFDESKLGTLEVENEWNRIRDIIYDLYITKEKSSTEICKLYNYYNSSNFTNHILKYLCIPKKTVSQATKENIKTGRLVQLPCKTQYKSGKHISWEGKEIFYRSSYELDYAKELDERKISYDVECLRIQYFNSNKNEMSIAIPDFYLKDSNTIVEIKSDWTLDKQNMIDKFDEYKKQGYNVKLILEHEEVDLYSL